MKINHSLIENIIEPTVSCLTAAATTYYLLQKKSLVSEVYTKIMNEFDKRGVALGYLYSFVATEMFKSEFRVSLSQVGSAVVFFTGFCINAFIFSHITENKFAWKFVEYGSLFCLIETINFTKFDPIPTLNGLFVCLIQDLTYHDTSQISDFFLKKANRYLTQGFKNVLFPMAVSLLATRGSLFLFNRDFRMNWMRDSAIVFSVIAVSLSLKNFYTSRLPRQQTR
ncbi:MAG: hypothetical protein L0207_06735 [Chlamydiae bacterium]|nr:hypothetical protein [Chlamydiota bacterium]